MNHYFTGEKQYFGSLRGIKQAGIILGTIEKYLCFVFFLQT